MVTVVGIDFIFIVVIGFRMLIKFQSLIFYFCSVTEININNILKNYFDRLKHIFTSPILNAYSSSISISTFNFVHINSKATDLKPRRRKDASST